MFASPSSRVRLFWLLFFASTLLVLQFHGPLVGNKDDVYHGSILARQSLWSWVEHSYTTWSARLTIDAVTVLVMPHVGLWRVLNAAMLVLLFWSIAALLRAENDLRLLPGMVAAFFLLDSVMVTDAMWWMTGSFNYLWPAALGAFAMLPFARPELPARLFVLTVPAVVYAAFQEQAGLLLVAFQCILGWRLVQQRRWRGWHLLQLAVTLACLAVVFASPGARRRYEALERWFPAYVDLSVLERLFSGLQLGVGHVFGGAGMGLGLVLLGLLYAKARLQHRGRMEQALTLLPLCVLLAPSVIRHLYPVRSAAESPYVPALRRWLTYAATEGGARYQDFWIGQAANAAAPGLYLVVAVLAVAAGLVAGALWLAFDGQRRGDCWPAALAVLVWLAALASTVAVGLTPSLYVSNQRIYWMQDMLVLGLAAAVFLRIGGLRCWLTPPAAAGVASSTSGGDDKP